jgi:parallel beta-helix repeat protein
MALFLLSPAFAAVNISSCGAGSVITASDIYTVNASLSGAPNAASTGNACIVIATDDVVVDCQGNSISHDDSANTEAIIVNVTASALSNVTIRNCLISDFDSGVFVEDPAGGRNAVTLTNNTISSNAYGVRIPGVWADVVMVGNLVANNTNTGYFMDDYFGGTIDMTRDRFLGNTADINYTTGMSGFTMDIADVIFGNADGAYGANTTVSHSSDSISWGMIDWVPSPAAPSANHVSFLNKSVNITPDYVDHDHDELFTVTMKWTNAEAISAIQESAIQLWLTNDSGNHLLNSSPDISNNEISASIYLNDSADSSVFSLYRNNGCPIITSSGSYVLDRELSGAPNGGSNGRDACVLIDTDDVVFDCDGHNITHDDSGNNAGIMVNGTTSNRNNITIKNCNIRDYDAGILVDSISSNRQQVNLTNNTLVSNNYGVSVPLGYAYVYMQENLVANSTTDGFLDASYFGDIINMSRDRFYGNGNDVDYPTGGSNLFINIFDVIFGDADGNYGANASVIHNTTSMTHGIIDWVPSPVAPSAGLVSFLNKSVNITPNQLAFSGPFDVIMKWTNAEGGSALHEAGIQMWLINDSGSFLLNSSPDTPNNQISTSVNLDDTVDSSVFALFLNDLSNITSCPNITMSGAYSLGSNLVGAPNSASPLGGFACVKIAASDVILDCNGYSITGSGSSNTYGVLLNGSLTNVTVKNCPGISGYSSGIYVYQSSGNLFYNNTVFNNTYGIQLETSSGNNLTNNTARNTTRGFYLRSSANNLLADNVAYNSTDSGFFLIFLASNNNLIANNTAYNNPAGFHLGEGPNNNTLLNNTAFNNSAGFYLFNVAMNNSLINNTAHDNDDGIYLNSNCSRNNLTGNWAYDNSGDGIRLDDSAYCVLSGNNASSNGLDGVSFSDSANNTLTGNTACDNGNDGFALYLTGSTNNTFRNNYACNNAEYGINLLTSNNNAVINNTAFNNQLYGFGISDNNLVANNTADGNADTGFDIYGTGNGISNNTGRGTFSSYGAFYLSGTGNTLTGNTAHNSTYGVHISNPGAGNNLFTSDHYYNNEYDFYVEESFGISSFTINLSNVIFDRPAGDYQNFTNLSLNDSVPVFSAYHLNWSAGSAPPSGWFSFAGKYIRITNETSGVSLDSVVWHWTPAELVPPYNESRFELRENASGTWINMTGTLNTGSHTFSLSGLNPASVYGLLQNNVSENCPIINTSDTTFVQSANYVGSPNNASPLSNFTCVKIAASNVIFDCNGYNITGNSSAGQTIGIEINGSYNNITVRNCPRIANYTYALYSLSATNVLVTNNTAVNDSYGFYMNGGSNINVTGNHVINMTQAGFDVIDGSAPRVFADNTADNVLEGYRTGSAPGVIFRNNSAYNATGFGFIIIANDNNLTGNRVILSPYAYDISSSSGAILVNNAANNSGVCFALYASNTATFTTNTATNCTSVAFDIFNSNRSSFAGNNATSPGSYAFQLSNVNLTNFTGNRAVGYSVYGISTVGSNLNRFVGNYVTGSTQGVHLDSSSNGNLIDTNNVVSNAVHGITVLSSQQNNITNNNASSSSNYGIYLVAAANNRIVGNNVTSNNQGIRLETSSDSNLVDQNTVQSNLNFGILVLNSQQVNVTRNNASLNNYGIYVSASNNRVLGNNASTNAQTGIYVTGSGSSYNLVADNLANGNTNYGIHVSSGGNNYNNLTNNTANLNGYGIRVEASQYCMLRNNRAGNNTNYGLYIGTAAHNTLADNNTAGDNGDYGFYLVTSNNCNLTNNLAFGNGDGLDAESSSGLNISGNVFNDNDGFGMRVWSVTGSTVNNNAAFDNPLSGIVLRESSGITATGNNAYDNGEAGMYLRLSDSNSILQNNASSNDLGGIYLNESDGNTLTDNLADSNIFVDMGLENSTQNAITRCNVSNSLYGFIFLGSPSNNLTDSIAYTFSDLGDGGGDPFLTTGGRAVYMANSSDSNFIANNQMYQASMIVVDVDASDGNLLRNNTLQSAFICAALHNGADASVLEFNRVGGCLLGSFMNASSGTAMSQNNFTGNLLGVGLFASNQSDMSMNRIGDNNFGLIHVDSEGTLMADDHFYNNSGGDLTVSMSITSPNAAINLSSVVFDSPGGIFENYTALSIDDTLGLEEYTVSWTNNASSLPLPADTFSFAQKYVTINDTTGNASIDRLVWHWLESELGSEYDDMQFGVWEYSGTWTMSGASLNSGANTITLSNANTFSDFAILESIPTGDEDPPSEQTEEGYDVRIIPACQGFIVEVKDGGSPVSNAFVKIMDQTTDTEMSPRYTNSSGQVFVPDCDIDVSVKASKGGRSGAESGMAECGFCPECAMDDDCSLSESCIDQLCIPIDCPDGMVVDHACERFECVKDSDCKANQSCISHHCKTVYECDYGLANTTEDDNADCDDNEYCDVPVGQPGGSCKPITGCGEISGHSITQWECGDAAGCPACAQGELCISHECVQNDLTCPASGIVGDNKTCQAKENGQPCINCDYEVTLPDGKKLTGKTDQSGNLGLPLKLAGTYKVTLFNDGQAVKVLSVKALPKSTPSEEKPPATGGMDLLMVGLFLIILAAFAFGIFLYWRRRKGQGQKKYGKK